MTDKKEQLIRAKLAESHDFLQRQRLLKALWKMQQKHDSRPAKADRTSSAA